MSEQPPVKYPYIEIEQKGFVIKYEKQEDGSEKKIEDPECLQTMYVPVDGPFALDHINSIRASRGVRVVGYGNFPKGPGGKFKGHFAAIARGVEVLLNPPEMSAQIASQQEEIEKLQEQLKAKDSDDEQVGSEESSETGSS